VDNPVPRSVRPDAQPWQRHPLTQLLAVLAAVTPLYGLSILSGAKILITGEMPLPTAWGSLSWALVYVSAFGLWVLALQYFICGADLAAFQLKTGTILNDIYYGVIYAFVLLLAMLAFQLLTAPAGAVEIPQANRAIADALAHDSLAFILWVGPVVWLQAAVLEELYRVFTLSRLWLVWPTPMGRALVLIGSSLLFGLGHLYQGPLGMAGTALIGAMLGYCYLRHGRVLPLIIAHGLYDTAALCGLVLLSKNGLI
jgi:membrane protease YdiL (CAAX protease family)